MAPVEVTSSKEARTASEAEAAGRKRAAPEDDEEGDENGGEDDAEPDDDEDAEGYVPCVCVRVCGRCICPLLFS